MVADIRESETGFDIVLSHLWMGCGEYDGRCNLRFLRKSDGWSRSQIIELTSLLEDFYEQMYDDDYDEGFDDGYEAAKTHEPSYEEGELSGWKNGVLDTICKFHLEHLCVGECR